MSDIQASKLPNAEIRALHKEWDDASCPICMDHPHNAVLLLCSSFDKGCRSYMCDTSYRHSNCLDRFKKLRTNSNTTEGARNLRRRRDDHHSGQTLGNTTASIISGEVAGDEGLGNRSTDGVSAELAEVDNETARAVTGHDVCGHLKCPLCRGTVHGWKVLKDAREYLDLKSRACTRESCSFVGNYHELRRHARRVHPSSRPADVDPGRQRSWHRMEHQREYGDIVSALRSSMPRAIVLGDYVLDNDDELPFDNESTAAEEIESGQWWTTLFLFHMLQPIRRRLDGRRDSSRSWRRHQPSSGGASSRRYPWGERLLNLYEDDDDDEWNSSADGGDDFSMPRRRRRFTRSATDDEQP